MYYGSMEPNPYDRELLDAFNELADANESGDRVRISRAETKCMRVRGLHRKFATGKEPWERL